MVNKWLEVRFRKLLRRRRPKENYRLILGAEAGDEIPIDSLIYPLRYDIVVRATFLDYYLGHRDVYRTDLDVFLAHPVAQAYLTSWANDASRSRPWLGRDPDALRSTFVPRMQRALALCDSLEESGFDSRNPITLRSATWIRHEHDKHVQRAYYAGDGCHRLAYLMLLGKTTLQPHQYCVRQYQEFRPRDNTYLLLGKLLRTEEEYCRFLSGYYCGGTVCRDRMSVIEHVQQHSPSWLDEVTSVMRVDLARVAEAARDHRPQTLGTAGGRRVPQD